MAGISGWGNSIFFERRKGRYGQVSFPPVVGQLEEVNPPFPGTMNLNDLAYSGGSIGACYQNTFTVTKAIGSLSWSSIKTATSFSASMTRIEGGPVTPEFAILGESGAGLSRLGVCDIDGNAYRLVQSGVTVTVRPFPGLYCENQQRFVYASGHAGSALNRLWDFNGTIPSPRFPFPPSAADYAAQQNGTAMGMSQPEEIIDLPFGTYRDIMVVGQGGSLATGWAKWTQPIWGGQVFTGEIVPFNGGITGAWFGALYDKVRNLILISGIRAGVSTILRSADGGITWSSIDAGFAAITCKVFAYRGMFLALIVVNAAPQRTVVRYSFDGIIWRTAIDQASIFCHHGVITPNGFYIGGNNGLTNNRMFRFEITQGA